MNYVPKSKKSYTNNGKMYKNVLKRISRSESMKEHSVGDYLQKDGDVYKIEPFQVHNEELAEYGLC